MLCRRTFVGGHRVARLPTHDRETNRTCGASCPAAADAGLLSRRVRELELSARILQEQLGHRDLARYEHERSSAFTFATCPESSRRTKRVSIIFPAPTSSAMIG